MPNIDLSILNQRQTPAFYADTLANRPAAGFVGRIFVSTDTFAFYRDNGTSWDLIGGPGTGTVTGTGANGQVTYWNGASTITGSNDLFFDAVNGHLGIGTITPGTALDVKHDQSTVVQLEQVTATNDIRIAFINSGVGLWRLGAFYNAGANDFGLFDIAAATQPVTVKRTTGQVLIGTSTVGSGKLVVASSTGDNGVQIVGASAPSLRIDNAESGPTKRAGLGISTATNNFIQGSADRDFCMFNGSTTASPILFGVYDAGAGNVQEAARISAARNFLIGTTTDAGQKLQVTGTTQITGNTYISGNLGVGTITPSDKLQVVGNVRSSFIADQTQYSYLGYDGLYSSNTDLYIFAPATKFISLYAGGSEAARIAASRNLLIGTTTDTGEKLQVNGTAFISGLLTLNSSFNSYGLGIIANTNESLRLTTNGNVGAIFQTYVTNGGTHTIGGDNAGGSLSGGVSYCLFIGAAATRDIVLAPNNVKSLTLKSSGVVNISSIPTSAVGLVSGDIYSNLGVLTIV